MILAQRILDCLRDNGPIYTRELPKWFGEVDRIELDTAVMRLMRQNSVSLELGKYDLVQQARPRVNGHKPFIAVAFSESAPSAAEEVAPSVVPETFECEECHVPQPDEAFRKSTKGTRYKGCLKCHGKLMRAAKEKPDDQLKGPEGECPQALLPAQGTTSKPALIEPQGKTGESLPSNLIKQVSSVAEQWLDKPEVGGSNPSPATNPHTPPPPQVGSTEPPATSSETPSEHLVHGTQTPSISPRDSEALSPVGAADPILTVLAHKRAQLVAKREQLTRDYESNLKAVIERIDEHDRITQHVKRLCEEEV